MDGDVLMGFDEWAMYGYQQGFCTPPVCINHDYLPTTATEDEADDGDEPCIFVIRLYDDLATKKAVEANHSPSVWRATNLGW